MKSFTPKEIINILFKAVKDKAYQSILEASVDKGEASAIALAIETLDCLLIIDDLKARKFAIQLNLNVTGTLGLFIDAKQLGVIPLVEPIIAKVRSTNFRISEKLKVLILSKANEK
jgi:predicted nucleic acid-binding protein